MPPRCIYTFKGQSALRVTYTQPTPSALLSCSDTAPCREQARNGIIESSSAVQQYFFFFPLASVSLFSVIAVANAIVWSIGVAWCSDKLKKNPPPPRCDAFFCFVLFLLFCPAYGRKRYSSCCVSLRLGRGQGRGLLYG